MVVKRNLLQILITFVVILLALNFAFAVCDANYQTYRHKSAVFYVANAAKIKVTVTNAMGDLYPRCFTAWIKVNGNYVNLDGLPYSPFNWQEAWKNEAPNCFNSGYRVASIYGGYAEYDLLKFNNNQPYTGIVEVRVSSDCYEVSQIDPCFCWNVNVEPITYQPPVQYGWLKVRVTDCSSYNPISGAKVCVQRVSSDPCSYTNSNGEVSFYLTVGSYLVQASKDGYNSKTTIATVKSGQTTEVNICLDKTKVCNPGEIVNRRCACPTQVAYEKCKADGSGWETIVEDCPSGYVCDNGYCVLNKDGWYDTGETRCNLNGNLCGYGTKEMKQEYRKYTCFGSTCTYVVTQTRWIAIDSCFVTCPTTTTTIPVQEKDGWYDTGKEKCEMNGLECGYGTKMKEQEYRDYTCFGVTCTYVVTARRWIAVGTCYQNCPGGYSCISGYCKPIFDCNSLDGWYSTGEEKCSSVFECGIAEKQVKEEYRDYYPIVSNPTSSSDCFFLIKDVRWRTIGSCYLSCPNGYYCDSGFCKLIPKSCEVKIWVKEENTNLPIVNANVCLNNKCYLTDSNGFASFYVNIGSYSLKISKDGYETKLITIACEDCGNPIYQTVTIKKIKTYFDCNILDGWYYTNESYCDMGGFECGKGLIMKKQEYRDYYGLADSSLQCTNYKVVAYRWVDDGYCQKNCSSGTCEEGFCKQTIKFQDVQLAPTYQEYEHPKPEENRIDFWILLFCLIALLLILLLFSKKRRSKQEDCCY